MQNHTPLAGHGVLLTRPEHQVSSLQQQLLFLGAEVICHPTLIIQPVVIEETFALAQFAWAAWVIFTSQNAVTSLPSNLQIALQQQALEGKTQIFAIGEATAECLRAAGLPVTDYPRSNPGSEGLYDCLMGHPLKSNILLVGGSTIRPWLANQLQKKGLSVNTLTVYQRVLPSPIPTSLWQNWESRGFDTLVFSSGEGFLNGMQLLSKAKSWIEKCLIVVVSERIATLVRQKVVCRDLVVANAAYDAEVVQAVLDYWQARS